MMEFTRIYGKCTEIADGYFEVEYKEYRADGSLHQIGTEDFSSDRLRTLRRAHIWTWDGEKRNNGGYRWFECERYVRFSNLKGLKQVAKAMYPEAALIDIRTF